MQTTTAQTETRTEAERSPYCDCPKPIPQERAERRGAAGTYCARCDRPIAVRWPRP